MKKIEKLSRWLNIVGCAVVLLAGIAAAVLEAEEALPTSSMMGFGIVYALFMAAAIGAAVCAGISAAKNMDTDRGFTEAVRACMLVLAVCLMGAAWKTFAALFLFGAKRIDAAERLTGTSYDDFFKTQFGEWGAMLGGGFVFVMLAVMSIAALRRRGR
ncbi:MAG: hypothetical protein QM689_06065 [Oscillospiraceae bacterium]